MFLTVSVVLDRSSRDPSVCVELERAVCEPPTASVHTCVRGEPSVTIMVVSRSQPEALCILNTDVGAAVSMSLCSYHAGRCHGDPLFFITEGVCDPAHSAKLDWLKFRAQMSSKSPVQEPCGLDTCYQWETCSGEEASGQHPFWI